MSSEDNKIAFCSYIRSLDEVEDNSFSNVFRIFDRGDFYSLYDVNAEILADTFFKSKECLKYLGPESHPLASCWVSKVRLPYVLKHILTILKKGVHLYQRPKNSPKNSLNWEIIKKATPGDMSAFSDDISNSSSSSTMCIQIEVDQNNIEKRICYIALIDTITCKLSACVLRDSEIYSYLDSCLAQSQPADTLVYISDDVKMCGEEQKILDLLTKVDTNIQQIPLSRLASSTTAVDLISKDSIQPDSLQAFQDIVSSDNVIVGPIFALLLSLSLLPISNNSDNIPYPPNYTQTSATSFSFYPIDVHAYVRIDQAAITALNLMPSPNDADKSMSLGGLLSRTMTKMGDRVLKEWVRLPLIDLKTITERHDIVECFTNNQSDLLTFRESLKAVSDVELVTKRLKKKIQTQDNNSDGLIKDLVELYSFSSRLPLMISALNVLSGVGSDTIKDRYLVHLNEAHSELSMYNQMIEDTIDLKAIDRHEYLVLPSFNDQLQSLEDKRAKLKRGMDRMLPDIITELGLDDKKVKMQRNNMFGFHFKVSRKNERNLRGKTTIDTLETRKDGVKFTCKAMRRLSSDYEDIMKEYAKTQQLVVSGAVDVVTDFLPLFDSVAKYAAELDVLASFAQVSNDSYPQYVRPTMVAKGTSGAKLDLVQARHPCVEAQANVSFIANDARLTKGESNVQIITGPNMGGKSTFIRSVGVVVIMAQIGCFVPCASATIPIVDAVLARVGAGDSQMKGVSTFMMEMLEASTILHTATSDSLIIIDELGRGTSTYDGFGLAWAIADYLATTVKAFTLFATHFHELTALADIQSSVVNRHVTAETQVGAITMLYQLREGSCDRSFGIHVAELANFPKEVVKMARDKAAELEKFGDESSAFIDCDDNIKKRKITASNEDVDVFLKNIFNSNMDSIDTDKFIKEAETLFHIEP